MQNKLSAYLEIGRVVKGKFHVSVYWHKSLVEARCSMLSKKSPKEMQTPAVTVSCYCGSQ
jgi:hypothetical protein